MAGFSGQKTLVDNLIFHLDFNNPKSYTSGSSTCTDLINQNTGNLINSPVPASDGKSLVFDGTDDYIDFDTTKPEICTFVMWVKHNGGQNEMIFNAGEHSAGPDLFLADSKIIWNIWDGAGNSFRIAQNENIPLNDLSTDWTHIALVNNNSFDSSKPKSSLYINGVFKGSCTYRDTSANNTLYIGGTTSQYMFGGNISKFQIYDKALTQEEIIENYESSYEQHFRNKPDFTRLINSATPTEYANAYEILQNDSNASSGYYTIKNPNINNGSPFLIYADMEYNGGGWTLLMYNPTSFEWNSSNTTLRNSNLPPNGYDTTSFSPYSILKYGDALKSNTSSFEYRIEAETSQSYGGIWTANTGSYSFTSSVNTNTDITLDTKFGTWNYADNAIEERMPYVTSTNNALLTTSESPTGQWWGTLIANHRQIDTWNPVPWTQEIQRPKRIWYWVR